MKKWFALAFVLGCSGGPESAPAAGDPAQDASAPEVADGSSDAPASSQGSDAAGETGTADPLAQCKRSACQASECGASLQKCGGQAVDCGACANGYYCGDNGRANMCGIACAERAWQNICAQGNKPSAHSFDASCTGAPYWVESGRQVFRPGFLQGCIEYQPNPTLTMWCCP